MTVDRIALAALCLLLSLSVAMRVLPAGDPVTHAAATGRPIVDLGDGVVLRAATAPRDVLIGACWTPISVEFVEPAPHGADTALAGPKNAGDRVFYAYHGWVLAGRFAATELTILHFAWRGASVLRLNRTAGRDTLAAKLTIPAGCEASPEEALAALRREERADR